MCLAVFLLFTSLFAETRELCGHAPPARAPLTLPQVVDYTFSRNPAPPAARQNLLSMKGQEVEAGLRQDRYNQHYLAEAKDVLAIAQYAYNRGGYALIDYLNALQVDRTTTLNALDADAQTWMAIHQLSYTSASNAVVP